MMREYLYVINTVMDGAEEAAGSTPRSPTDTAPKPPPAWTQIPPASRKSVTEKHGWITGKEAGICIQKFQKENISGKGWYSQCNGKAVAVHCQCGSCLQHLLSCDPEVSCILTLNEWPWSVLLFYSRAWAEGGEVTHREVNSNILPVAFIILSSSSRGGNWESAS